MMVMERGFEGLDFYQENLVLVRAACSVSLNIAEGYGRYHYLDRLRFLYMARGSLYETLSAFVIAANLGYCQEEQLTWVRACCKTIEKDLNGYIRFQRNQQQGSTEYGAHTIADPPTPYTAPLSPIPNPLSPIPNSPHQP